MAAVADLLGQGGGVVLVAGGLGIGKTSLVDAACGHAAGLGYEVLRARGRELERDFAFGIVRQLFERRLARAPVSERRVLLSGPAGAVRPLLLDEPGDRAASDTSFAVLHGLYWLTANLADQRPVLIAVDDAHWADEPSLRWLVHLAPRLGALAVAVIVALRPVKSRSGGSLEALRAEASAPLRPGPLSGAAVDTLVRRELGAGASDSVCPAVWEASCGNPLYVTEVVRAVELTDPSLRGSDIAALMVSGGRGDPAAGAGRRA